MSLFVCKVILFHFPTVKFNKNPFFCHPLVLKSSSSLSSDTFDVKTIYNHNSRKYFYIFSLRATDTYENHIHYCFPIPSNLVETRLSRLQNDKHLDFVRNCQPNTLNTSICNARQASCVLCNRIASPVERVGKIIGQKLRIFTSFCPIINQILSKNQILNS